MLRCALLTVTIALLAPGVALAEPETRITSPAPADETTDRSPSFTFTGEGDGPLSFECAHFFPGDEPQWAPCTSPHRFAQALPIGTRTVAARAVDSSGPDPTPASWTFNILNSVSVEDVRVAESSEGTSSMAEVAIELATPEEAGATVVYETRPGSAHDGVDFAGRGPAALWFAPGQTRRVVSIPVLGDDRDEPDESFDVVLTEATLALRDATAAVTIADDDSTVVLGQADGDEGRTVALPVTVVPAPARQIELEYDVRGLSAAEGADFRTARGTLVIPAGRTQTAIPVALLEDDVREPGERLEVVVTRISGASAAPGPGLIGLRDVFRAPVNLSPPQLVSRGEGTETECDPGRWRYSPDRFEIAWYENGHRLVPGEHIRETAAGPVYAVGRRPGVRRVRCEVVAINDAGRSDAASSREQEVFDNNAFAMIKPPRLHQDPGGWVFCLEGSYVGVTPDGPDPLLVAEGHRENHRTVRWIVDGQATGVEGELVPPETWVPWAGRSVQCEETVRQGAPARSAAVVLRGPRTLFSSNILLGLVAGQLLPVTKNTVSVPLTCALTATCNAKVTITAALLGASASAAKPKRNPVVLGSRTLKVPAGATRPANVKLRRAALRRLQGRRIVRATVTTVVRQGAETVTTTRNVRLRR